MLRNIPNSIIYIILFFVLLISIFFSLTNGAVELTLSQIGDYIKDMMGMNVSGEVNKTYEGIFFQIRLPRVLLCIAVGGILSVSGFVMQTIFRNPIVEPGIIGTSSGAAFGAAMIFVFGKLEFFNHFSALNNFLLPLAAFAGGLASTYLVYWFASYSGKINITSMILAGMAVNAISGGGTGFLSYIARDPQARSITFWNLGTFSGADWNAVLLVYVIAIPSFLYILYKSKDLNAFRLGENEAMFLGVNTDLLKIILILINTLMVAAATSMVGVISFVGLIVPHILRLIKGSESRYLAISSSLLGGVIVLFADLFSRTIVAPAEIPIGIVTAFTGAPLFLFLLKKMKKKIMSGGIYA